MALFAHSFGELNRRVPWTATEVDQCLSSGDLGIIVKVLGGRVPFLHLFVARHALWFDVEPVLLKSIALSHLTYLATLGRDPFGEIPCPPASMVSHRIVANNHPAQTSASLDGDMERDTWRLVRCPGPWRWAMSGASGRADAALSAREISL